MTQGFQAFDATGFLVCDLTDRITKIIGQVYVNGGSSGSVLHSEIKPGSGWYSFVPDLQPNTITGMILPLLSVNDGSISWSYPEAGNASSANLVYGGYLLYGVY
jgi:hypothetical protein